MEINQPEEKRRLTRRQTASLILAGVGLILLITGLLMMRGPAAPPEVGVELSSQSEANTGTWSLSQIRQDYPVGKLVVTTDRQSYESGDLRLVIPALDQDLLVQNGVDTDSLRSGPGLYEYSQLPAPDTNANVSIAGHRDIEGAEFYYIDRLADGDLMYLVYQEKAYIYRYESTQIIESDDWNPIACKEYPCLTLTSCDPIGTFVNRIVVTGRLIDVREMDGQMEFAANDNSFLSQAGEGIVS